MANRFSRILEKPPHRELLPYYKRTKHGWKPKLYGKAESIRTERELTRTILFNDLSIDEVLEGRQHGVPASYIYHVVCPWLCTPSTGIAVRLTEEEFRTLMLLRKNGAQTTSYEEIELMLHGDWDEWFEEPLQHSYNSIMVHVYELRTKLALIQKDGTEKPDRYIIETHRSFGYQLLERV